MTREIVRSGELLMSTDEDEEYAFLLQIEEIIAAENANKNENMDKQSEQTNLSNRLFVMIMTIKQRYAEFVTQNETLVNQLQKLLVEVSPLLLALKTNGKIDPSKLGILATGLAAKCLTGENSLDETKEMTNRLIQLVTASGTWLECFKNLSFLLIALTYPRFVGMAMTKLTQSIESSK